MANQPKKYKKFVATAATATLVAAAIVPVASAAGFTDVKGSSHEEAINALAEAGIINGYADGTFKPNQDVNRGQVVKLLGRWLETEGYEAPADWETKQYFKDLPLTAEKELLKYAALSKEAGVFAGSNGNLNYTQKMQRQQMAVVLVRAINEIYGLDLVKEYKAEKFTSEIADLDKAFSAEQREAITALEYAELTNVTTLPGKKFNPANSITRGQFASFLYRTINIDVATDASVKAINNTTVEVTFDEEVENIQALNFEIKDLEVKNAAVKQSNKKVVVLTTAPQTAGKEYTVSLNAEEIGKFKGIEAVIPTSVDIVEKSQQNVLGNQVTVKAKVTVAEGQSKAGIPVTFNIVNNANTNSANSNLNQPIVAEAVTDENGVATYTYTRYASTSYQLTTNDEVQAYATGKPALRSFAKVYWAAIQPLTITDVTEGNAINNGGKKVYKVKLAGAVQGDKINVGFLENVDVTPDKAIKTVTVTDSNGRDLGYPGQFVTSTGNQTTTTNSKVVELTLDKNGETTFTLTGSNATVTPFVFKDVFANTPNTDPSQGRFDATELFAKAAAVTFAKTQTLGLAVENVGVKDAASYKVNPDVDAKNNLIANTGGRTYKATLTDKNGKTAQTGTPVYVSVKYGTALNKADKDANVYLYDFNAKKLIKLDEKNSSAVKLLTDSKGQISFKLVGEKDSYATPTIFAETGDKVGLDSNDLQQVGEIVYFGDAVVNTAKLLVEGKAETSVVVSNEAEFTYSTVDQNDNEYDADKAFTVTFEVSTTFNPANVKVGTGIAVGGGTSGYLNYNTLPDTVPQGSTRSYAVQSSGSKASIKIDAASGTQVSVKASGGSFPISTASATFSNVNNEGIEAGQKVTGKVVAVDKDNKLMLLTNSKGDTVYELSYKDADLYVKGQKLLESTFEGDLSVGDELTFTQAKDNNSKATFDNTDKTSGLDVKAGTKIILSNNKSVYDFGNAALDATKTLNANFEIKASNVTLKNAVIKGNVTVTESNKDDFTLENVTLDGDLIVNGGDGDTVNLKKASKVEKLHLNIKEHLVVAEGSTVKEVIVKSKAKGSKVEVKDAGSNIALLVKDVNATDVTVEGDVTNQKTVDLSDTTAPTATAKYAEVPAKEAGKETPAKAAKATVSGIELVAKTPGVIGNGIAVKLVAGAEDSTETKVEVKDKEITVTYKKDATVSEVADAINGNNEAKVLVEAKATGTDKAKVEEATLSGGAEAIPGEAAVPASYKLTFTFSEAIANTSEVEFFVGESTTAEKAEWDADKKVATVTLKEALPEATKTATVKKAADANGNVIKQEKITITR